MALRCFAVLLLVACGLAIGPVAHAQNRLAFIVGNDSYQNVTPLKKAVNDARSTGATLSKLGFRVTSGENLTRRQFNERFSTFESAITPGDTVFFFYSGHGVEMDGSNYLIPVDAPLARQQSLLKSESVSTNTIVQTLKARGARTIVMVLDACRDDPFLDSNGRSMAGTRGFGRFEPPSGTGIFIVYSAGNGQIALDRLSDTDTNPNSVFTRSFLPLLEEQKSLSDVVRATRTKVQALANSIGHAQFPAYYDQINGDVFLAGTASRPIPAPGPSKQPPMASLPSNQTPVIADIGTSQTQTQSTASGNATSASGPIASLPPPPPADTLWDHNNSVMRIRTTGNRIEIFYQAPRQGMIDEGVTSGTLLFSGQRNGGKLSGTAYVFDRRCGKLPYQDEGEILGDNRIILNGRRVPTQLTSDCRVAGYRSDASIFSKR